MPQITKVVRSAGGMPCPAAARCAPATAALVGSTPKATRAGPKNVKTTFCVVDWEPVSMPRRHMAPVPPSFRTFPFRLWAKAPTVSMAPDL